MCTLSIVIPVYNVERYLPKCLDSLLIETSVPYEIILVNDGSTDASLAVAEGYRARFPERITVVTTENMGQGNARNVGLERAKGEFLYFIDSDDYLAPGGMEGILSCLKEDFDICIFDTIAVNADGTPNTAHSLNTVQFVVINAGPAVKNVKDGALCNVAPTILKLMGIPQPAAMTAEPLI